jgi:hypothetical protein
MQSPEQDNPLTTPAPTQKQGPVTTPNFSGTPQPIQDLAGREDFPQCALGAFIDIQGFSGVVIEIVNQSIKVRPVEGSTQRFNANRLRTLYSPAIRPEPTLAPIQENLPAPRPATAEPDEVQAKEEMRVYIAEPNFSAPIQPIDDYASQPDFPKCVYGKHVDILGYTGVVIEIVKGSLKVQSPVGISRSYNAEVLRKNYGKSR